MRSLLTLVIINRVVFMLSQVGGIFVGIYLPRSPAGVSQLLFAEGKLVFFSYFFLYYTLYTGG